MQRFARILDTVGDGTGSVDGAVDGSSTAVIFKLSPHAEARYEIARLRVLIRDGTGFQPTQYGLLAQLTNGVQVGWMNDAGTDIDESIIGGVVKNNEGWALAADRFTVTEWPGATNDTVVIEIDLGVTVKSLRESPNQPALAVKVQDNLTGLGAHQFMVVGEAA